MASPKPNFARMMAIIDEVFETRNDPEQIQVNPAQMKKLQAIHPATLTELSDENGPLSWVLMIPTTKEIMENFLQGSVSEKQVLENTPTGASYGCIYLCSATTLPELRGKGETKKLCLDAIRSIQADHPIHTLFVWPFTDDGKRLAETLAKESGLALLTKAL